MPELIIYRLAEAWELPDIWKLRCEAWADVDGADSNATGWAHEEDHGAAHWVAVAVESTEILGAVRVTVHNPGARLPDDEIYGRLLDAHRRHTIAVYNRLVVAPVHRRRGIASELEERCIQHAISAGASYLVGSTASVAATRHRLSTMTDRGFVILGVASNRYEGAPFPTDTAPTILALQLRPIYP